MTAWISLQGRTSGHCCAIFYFYRLDNGGCLSCRPTTSGKAL